MLVLTARGPVPEPLLLGRPAPLAGPWLRARLEAVPAAAADWPALPAPALVLVVDGLLDGAAAAEGVLGADAHLVRVDALRETGRVHDAQAPAQFLGLGVGDPGAGGAVEAQHGDEAEKNGGVLHADDEMVDASFPTIAGSVVADGGGVVVTVGDFFFVETAGRENR